MSTFDPATGATSVQAIFYSAGGPPFCRVLPLRLTGCRVVRLGSPQAVRRNESEAGSEPRYGFDVRGEVIATASLP